MFIKLLERVGSLAVALEDVVARKEPEESLIPLLGQPGDDVSSTSDAEILPGPVRPTLFARTWRRRSMMYYGMAAFSLYFSELPQVKRSHDQLDRQLWNSSSILESGVNSSCCVLKVVVPSFGESCLCIEFLIILQS